MKKFAQEQFGRYMDNMEKEFGPMDFIKELKNSARLLVDHVTQAEDDLKTYEGRIGSDTADLLDFELGWIQEAIMRLKKLG